ncbi:MAG: riboflavin synthase [Candidatus Kapabacteria bacterium]|jgi:riboflavin synthase|nr:riboflavin synthase [Candidatus Kapabacteria bacterium]
MFTGLVEEIGAIRSMRPQGKGFRISVAAKTILHDLKIDDSVSINGACQTVVRCDAASFDVEAVEETILKTTLGTFQPGKRVNLERALALGARLGGHIVQGHVDTRGTVRSVEEQQTSWLLSVEFPKEYARYIVPVGSICIDGVSLTAARVGDSSFTVAVIPHTWANTTLQELSVGNRVNLEFDIIGKYVERMMLYGQSDTHAQTPHETSPSGTSSGGMTETWLASMGY